MTDRMGFTEAEWERTWESETATATVHRAAFDDEDEAAWQKTYDEARAAGASEAAATEAADAAGA